MKNIKTNLFGLILLVSLNALGQTPDLTKQVQTIEKQSQDRYSELNSEFLKLKLKFESLDKEVQDAKKTIATTSGVELATRQARIEQKKLYVSQTSAFVKSASKSFRAIDASIAQATYMGEVIKLNNPTNEDLGFSLKQILNDLIQTHILNKDKSLGKSGKVNQFVTGLIEHPITELAKSAVPAINTVVSFISNLCFNSKKIDEKDFNKFTQELKKYVEHYEGIANATKEYESNLQQIKIRSAALELYLESFTFERVSQLYPSVDFSEEKKKYTFNELLRKYYSIDIVNQEIDKCSCDLLIASQFNYPITALNQARYIQDELNSLSNQYIRVNYSYYEEISKTLTKSKELDEKYVPKIDKKIDDLKVGLLSWLDKYETLVDVEDVKREFNKLIK